MIHLRSQQMIQHVHSRGEQDSLICLTCFPCQDASEECLSHAGIADQYDIGTQRQEGKIQQTKNAVLRLHAALVVVEVESVNARLRLQARALEATLDGAPPARLQFHVCEPFDGGRNAEIAGCGFRDSRLDLAAHHFQVQQVQFLFERGHRVPFRIQE